MKTKKIGMFHSCASEGQEKVRDYILMAIGVILWVVGIISWGWILIRNVDNAPGVKWYWHLIAVATTVLIYRYHIWVPDFWSEKSGKYQTKFFTGRPHYYHHKDYWHLNTNNPLW